MIRERHAMQVFIFAALLAAIGLNALQFATRAANPLVVSDGWSAVDTVVRKIPSGEFAASDLFVKRNFLDHSQPLRKLIMVFHYRYFDLDFGIESMIGIMFAFFNLVLLWWIAHSAIKDDEVVPNTILLVFAAIASVYLSLNADVVFSWPLLTLNYTTHTFILLFAISVWFALYGNGWEPWLGLLATAIIMNVVSDDTGLIVSVAALIAIAIQAWHGVGRRRKIYVTAIIIGTYLAYRLGYTLFAPNLSDGQEGHEPELFKLIFGLIKHWPEAWQWVGIPLAASVMHRSHLSAMSEASTPGIEYVISAILLVAHAWFWWRAMRERRNLCSFIAVVIMLLFYGLLAALLVGRISVKDVSYLWQPRYVLVYQWNLVALLLMGVSQLGSEANRLGSREANHAGKHAFLYKKQLILLVSACLLLLLQISLSADSWSRLKYSRAYQQRMAFQIGMLARQPTLAPTNCMPQVVVCGFAVARRVRLLQFLKNHHLNLFSPNFQARHRLYPDIETLSKWMPAKADSAAKNTCSSCSSSPIHMGSRTKRELTSSVINKSPETWP